MMSDDEFYAVNSKREALGKRVLTRAEGDAAALTYRSRRGVNDDRMIDHIAESMFNEDSVTKSPPKPVAPKPPGASGAAAAPKPDTHGATQTAGGDSIKGAAMAGAATAATPGGNGA